MANKSSEIINSQSWTGYDISIPSVWCDWNMFLFIIYWSSQHICSRFFFLKMKIFYYTRFWICLTLRNVEMHFISKLLDQNFFFLCNQIFNIFSQFPANIPQSWVLCISWKLLRIKCYMKQKFLLENLKSSEFKIIWTISHWFFILYSHLLFLFKMNRKMSLNHLCESLVELWKIANNFSASFIVFRRFSLTFFDAI